MHGAGGNRWDLALSQTGDILDQSKLRNVAGSHTVQNSEVTIVILFLLLFATTFHHGDIKLSIDYQRGFFLEVKCLL